MAPRTWKQILAEMWRIINRASLTNFMSIRERRLLCTSILNLIERAMYAWHEECGDDALSTSLYLRNHQLLNAFKIRLEQARSTDELDNLLQDVQRWSLEFIRESQTAGIEFPMDVLDLLNQINERSLKYRGLEPGQSLPLPLIQPSRQPAAYVPRAIIPNTTAGSSANPGAPQVVPQPVAVSPAPVTAPTGNLDVPERTVRRERTVSEFRPLPEGRRVHAGLPPPPRHYVTPAAPPQTQTAAGTPRTSMDSDAHTGPVHLRGHSVSSFANMHIAPASRIHHTPDSSVSSQTGSTMIPNVSQPVSPRSSMDIRGGHRPGLSLSSVGGLRIEDRSAEVYRQNMASQSVTDFEFRRDFNEAIAAELQEQEYEAVNPNRPGPSSRPPHATVLRSQSQSQSQMQEQGQSQSQSKFGKGKQRDPDERPSYNQYYYRGGGPPGSGGAGSGSAVGY